MTTVVATRNMIVTDSLVSDGSTVMTGSKIHRVNECIIACAGNWNDGLKFVDWIKNKRKKKPELESFEALMVTSTGDLISWDEDLVPNYLLENYWAIGTGRDFALGAMAMGSTPQEAVRVAIGLDVYSGLPLSIEKI